MFKRLGNVFDENYEMIQKTKSYELYKVYDERTSSSYMELVGGLNGDYWIYESSPRVYPTGSSCCGPARRSHPSCLLRTGRLTVSFAETDPVFVWADEYMAEEVVMNYVSNAVNHQNARDAPAHYQIPAGSGSKAV